MNNTKVRAAIALLTLAGSLVHGPVRADQVVADDLIVQGSACVGLDCVNNESFGFDTIRLKENNLRIKFEDTSTSAGFPTTDWQIIVNDSASGGRSYFGVDNVSTSSAALRIYDGAGGAVAIGEGSTDGGVGTMSVGSATATRRIVNVADGIADSDAATVGQLNSIVGAESATTLQANIDSEAATRSAGDAALQGTIDSEAATRQAADAALQNNVAAEANTRATADATLQNSINAEAATRSAADATLQNNIDNEADARIAADDALQVRLDSVESRLDDVGALASAFSALVPNARATGNTQISLGLGNYAGATALAGGVFHYVSNNVLLNAGVSSSFKQQGTAARAGITIGW